MSHENPVPEPSTEPSWDPPVFDPSPPAAAPATVAVTTTDAPEAAAADAGHDQEDPHAGPGGLVRIELFLPPEQLAHFFRAVVATQHAIMTLREAAAYLRISATKLRALAEEGGVPAFLVEGHWRFAKQSVDEWIALQRRTEEDSHAA